MMCILSGYLRMSHSCYCKGCIHHLPELDSHHMTYMSSRCRRMSRMRSDHMVDKRFRRGTHHPDTMYTQLDRCHTISSLKCMVYIVRSQDTRQLDRWHTQMPYRCSKCRRSCLKGGIGQTPGPCWIHMRCSLSRRSHCKRSRCDNSLYRRLQ